MRNLMIVVSAIVANGCLTAGAAAQEVPSRVAEPLREWRLCVEHMIAAPYNELSRRLVSHATGREGCPDARRRTLEAIAAVPESDITPEAIERYIEQIGQRAYDVRKAAEAAAVPKPAN